MRPVGASGDRSLLPRSTLVLPPPPAIATNSANSQLHSFSDATRSYYTSLSIILSSCTPAMAMSKVVSRSRNCAKPPSDGTQTEASG